MSANNVQLRAGMANPYYSMVPRQTSVGRRTDGHSADLLTSETFSIPEKSYSTHRLLIGTHTSGNDTNYLQIAEVQLPNQPTEQDPRRYDEEREEIGGYGGGAECRLNIQQKIVHEGEVNKARYMPQKPDVIATMCADGNVLIFDKTRHPLKPATETKCIPEMTLQGHDKEG